MGTWPSTSSLARSSPKHIAVSAPLGVTGLRELLAGIGRVLCRAEEVSLDAVEKVPLHLQRGGAPWNG